MGNRIIRLSLFILVGLMLIAGQQKALAQDEGPPALQQLAFFTVGGAAGGVVFGIAVWMLDPLAPSADIRLNMLSGMGGGSLIGFVFGILQLNKQATFPYREQPVPVDPEDGAYSPPLLNPELLEYQLAAEGSRNRGVPLFGFNYRF